MSSTIVLISLMLSLSIAVIFPELQYTKTINNKISDEFEFMVSKQRKGFLILGLVAVFSFFISIQTLSVTLFVLHLLIDALFGVYAYLAFQVRVAATQTRNLQLVNINKSENENIEYIKQAV